jgi:predicted outer membrane protein
MDRRNALMTFSGILASSALIAVPRRSALAQAAADTPARITMTEYKAQTLAAGNFSKQISQLAVTNANHPRVKEFAEFEVAEQTTVAQVLTDSANPPPLALGTQQAEVMGQLQAQSGKDFDSAYVQAQIAGHRQLLTIQQAFLNAAMAGQEYEPIAVMARMVIQMHLTMLQDLQNQIAA